MSTQLIKTITEYQEIYKDLKNKSLGFVPTMGALHDGHLSLINKAKQENDVVVASIFVNPTQFNNSEDLKKYPRTVNEDLNLLSKAKVDILFCPEIQDMYPDDYRYKVTEDQISKILCGNFRPGHFNGVLTVVMKLFNIIKPQRAYFGEKDFQQLKLIKDMVDSFFMDIEIVSVPTVRDKDGLALSSRNQRLSQNGIEKATQFAKILNENITIDKIKTKLKEKNIEVEYVEEHFGRRFAAVHIEGVRLIDNR